MGQDSNLVRFLMRSLGALSIIIDGQTRLESCPTESSPTEGGWLARAKEAAVCPPGLPPWQPCRPKSQAIKNPPKGGGGVQRGVRELAGIWQFSL